MRQKEELGQLKVVSVDLRRPILSRRPRDLAVPLDAEIVILVLFLAL